MVGAFFQALLDLLYPPQCPACGRGVDAQGQWCPACLGPLWAWQVIAPRSHRLRFLAGCFVVCRYTGAVRKLLQEIKFRDRDSRRAALRWPLEQSAGRLPLAGIDAVLPVPLHPRRRRERGYNQTELIFAAWAAAQGLPWLPELLVRCRDTEPQWQLPPEERRRNIRGAFAVNGGRPLRGQRLLLVDDIFTTGATMDECARTLLAAGAARVSGLALAGSLKN